MKKLRLCIFTVVICSILSACKDNSSGSTDAGINIRNESVTLNPSGVAPLTATIEFEAEEEVGVSIRVVGTNGPESDIIHQFSEMATRHEIPVLGLYPDFENTVELTFYLDGTETGSKIYTIETDELLADLPDVDINTASRSEMIDGLTFVSYFGHRAGGETTPQRPFMFDSFGDIRWYLDYGAESNSQFSELQNLFYDDGMERLQNGNLYFGSGGSIYEINMLGEILNSWPMQGYSFHHEVTEKPDGNFLVTVHKNGIDTIEDHIIEIDRSSGQIINVWDLRESLDRERTAWPISFGDISVDWFHANALYYDDTDNTIVVSGRSQGVVKLTENNEVVWIIAPHKEWETSGNGTDLNQFLLNPLDANDESITDNEVLLGNTNHVDFEWAWYQHAPLRMPNGNVLLFDNGDNRNYQSSPLYSRAVEYEIDEENMTIKQVWAYGKERGGETFSRIVSDVDYYPDQNHLFFIPGAVNFQGASYGKTIELDYSSREIIFEATITPPQAAFGIITLHRTERMKIYPD
ncbi:MAG: aryl-sulfate sulfotransferase [Balneolaceae bacterium]